MKIAKIESIPLRIPFTTGGPSDAGVWGKAGLEREDTRWIARSSSDDRSAEAIKQLEQLLKARG